jgi:serine/threonine protein kinase
MSSRYPKGWSAPEVVKIAHFAPASDICSFGILLWALFRGLNHIFTFASPHSHILITWQWFNKTNKQTNKNNSKNVISVLFNYDKTEVFLGYFSISGVEPTFYGDDTKQTVRERLQLDASTLIIPPKFLQLILQCVEEEHTKRPTIADVLNQLDQINNEL